MTAPAAYSPTVLELFAGIGGLSLGLERAGFALVGQVEINPFCRSILARHWPEVPRHDDVRTTPLWWAGRPAPDLIAGGFPCQPASGAGHKLGPADPRWLWPAMADVIAAIRPGWVVIENVPGLRTRGLAAVLADLDRLGYFAAPGTIAACEMGAPHPRERLLILAHAQGVHGPARLGSRHHGQPPVLRPDHRAGAWRDRVNRAVEAAARPDRGADGVPAGLDAARVHALGNAVVPAVAEHIGRLIYHHVTASIGAAA
jgi:DNA (cytosine-5)-methyltransferase 1